MSAGLFFSHTLSLYSLSLWFFFIFFISLSHIFSLSSLSLSSLTSLFFGWLLLSLSSCFDSLNQEYVLRVLRPLFVENEYIIHRCVAIQRWVLRSCLLECVILSPPISSFSSSRSFCLSVWVKHLIRKGSTTRSRLLGIASPDFYQFVGLINRFLCSQISHCLTDLVHKVAERTKHAVLVDQVRTLLFLIAFMTYFEGPPYIYFEGKAPQTIGGNYTLFPLFISNSTCFLDYF